MPTPIPTTAASSVTASAPTEVEVVFTPSRQMLNVGDSWSVTGEISNRSKDRPIWIVDTRAVLIVAPEVFGDDSVRWGLPAIFPTMVYSQLWTDDKVIRIDPGSKYAVIWKLGARSPYQAVVSHAFFSPGQYRATALVHVWYTPPILGPDEESDERGQLVTAHRVLNLHESAAITSSRDLAFDASLVVLLVGAAIGGLLAWTLQAALREHTGFSLLNDWSRLARFGANFVAAVLLPVVVTLLLARLSAADSPIAIRVRDLWGAIATGFVVQWVGLPLLAKTLGGFGAIAPAARAPAKSPTDSAASEGPKQPDSAPAAPATATAPSANGGREPAIR
jgi:hypothetical protein